MNQFYSIYGKSNDALYNKEIPQELFTPDLKVSLEKAFKKSKDEIEKVKNSNHSEDKPLIFEGSFFSSLYEGYTSYKIESIKIMESTQPVGSAADVLIDFENASVTPKIKWTDKIHLVEAFDTEMKIENIFFDKKIGGAIDLKTKLYEFSEVD
ncbi:hypothetical protein [Chryseobacterium sp. MEBOG07]|uniref:hypothetical protein n=1 Tax=Chryseobacterium sp. MEBOG07 TaxID=2879939 RepID=UPI001F34BC5B|nr:hypothetical protein [Chryseobacterium sp. MEBOG07]UKB78337.1 hypothetical protein LF886_17900 [Chryseobacterium sp. MEBOG07]